MVKIALPNPDDYQGNIKQFLRQLELAVHHAQKAYDQLIEDGSIEDTKESDNFICYRHPKLDFYDLAEQQKKDGTSDGSHVNIHVDDGEEKVREIEIEIS